jgi:two-component system sensor histidine kinase QseC
VSHAPRSLQGRLLALVLGMVVAVWCGTAVMTWFDVRHELDELLDSHLAQAAALLVVQQTHDVGEDEHEADTPTLHRYAPKVAFQVFHEGRLVMRSANASQAPMAPHGEAAEAGFQTAQIAGETWRVFTTYGAEHDVQVFVGEHMASRSEILLAVLRSTLWPMAVSLPLLALAIWWAVSRGLLPMRKLASTLNERQPQSLEPVSMGDAPAEMAPMLDALNTLFTRIAELMASERRFTADAAHELRTPIAAIRTQAQVAMGETDDALRQHALQSTIAGCDRATRLVAQLLTLSRLESGVALASSSVDLCAVIRGVVADLAPKAIAKQQTIEVDAPGARVVHGDGTLLGVLVRNLIDNAIRYSPAQSSVQVSLIDSNQPVTLTVSDSGPGMSDEAMACLGDRFFRVLGSEQDGSGLGWSIVRRIAAVHQATVHTARSTSLGGMKVMVEFPIVSNAKSI